MEAIKKIEWAIEEVKKNPKYKKNRIWLLKLLEARLLQIMDQAEKLKQLNEEMLINWSQN